MSQEVRVRFAPSPTGPLHIGGVRTALFNYLFAKKNKGTFILRIEDTDQTRFVPEAESYINNALNWCEIPYDEGPSKPGKYGPYKQSERKEIYKEYCEKLINKGNAYYAFDTPESLDGHRKSHEEKGKTFIYNWHNRLKLDNSLVLSTEEVEQRIANGDKYVVRFKSPQDETLLLEDEIRGQIKIDTNVLDDKILFKSDGMPTYHLANIVDDHLMKISHVIRGEEWLPSLALHVLLYRAFGWDAPKFAHLPLILKPDPSTYLNKNSVENYVEKYTKEFLLDFDYNEDEVKKTIKSLIENFKNISTGLKINVNKDSKFKKDVKTFLKSCIYGKLSKRDGDRIGFPVFPMQFSSKKGKIRGFKEDGYLPEAVVNFLAFLGWNPGTEQEIFSLEDLVASFSLERVNKAGAKFDPEKAKWFNQQYFVNQDDAKITADFIAFKPSLISDKHDENYIQQVVGLVKERAVFVNDLWDLSNFFFEAPTEYNPKAFKKAIKEDTPALINELVTVLEEITDFTTLTIQDTVKGWITSKEIGFGKIMQPLRLSLVGEMKGPDVFEIINLLGKQETINRLQAIIK